MSVKQNRNQGSAVTRSTGRSTQGKKMGRIVDIIMSDKHPAYISPEDTPFGTIFFTPFGFHTEAADKNATFKAKPLSINNITYPLIGEIVILAEEIPVGNDYYDDLEGDISSTEFRYGGTVSVHNNSSNNALPTQANSRKSKPKQSSNVGNEEAEDIQLGNYFKENSDLNPLAPGEGDSIMEGKNGQRIRFTTTGPTGTNPISNGVTDDPDDGNPSIGDKAMVLSLGNGSQENVTNDAASIYMLENQSLPIDATSTNIDSLNSTYEPLIKPLDQISAKPTQVIPQTLSSQELTIQPIDFNITAPETEQQSNPEPVSTDISQSVFDALDEAQDEGLLRFDEESVAISGTAYDSGEEGQAEVCTPTEDDGSIPEEVIAGDFKNINVSAESEWNTGGIGFFKNKSGKALRLGRPDKNLTMQASTTRDIKYLVLHTSGSSERSTPASLTRFFFNERDGSGWNTGGYHWIVGRKGKATRIYSDDIETNGAKGINSNSIHLNWIGGFSPDGAPLNFNITKGQIFTFKRLIKKYIETYPDIKVLGHNQISNKSCPLFSVPTYLEQIDIDRDNIETRVNFAGQGFYSKWDGTELKQEARRLALLV